jgi:NNP family nitrate/nitrite transporter-like MFS transporter
MIAVPHESTSGERQRVLWLSTIAFTLMFAVWLMLGMLAITIRQEFGLTEGQLYNLTLAAILSGSLLRFNFGVWTDKYGGRRVMTILLLLVVVPTALVSQVTNYHQLLALAMLYGIAGNSFSVGIAWTAAWYPKEKQGLALGVFGAGNVGASVTKLFGPMLIALVPITGFFGGAIPGGWRFIPCVYAALLVVMAAAVWFLAPKYDRTPAKGKKLSEVVAPMKHLRVWEYSLHYVVVFGAYVALSGLLPTYILMNYGAEIAGMLGLNETLVKDFAAIKALKGDAYKAFAEANPAIKADSLYLMKWVGFLAAICYVFPASLLRPLGGWLSDRFGAKIVMASVFVAMLAAGLMLTLPLGLSAPAFILCLFVLGAAMGVGKASVYKMIPESFPQSVGAVGGLVGLLGALGGVLVPLGAAPLVTTTKMPQMLFGTLLFLTLASSVWFTASTVLAERKLKPPVESLADPVAA